MTIPFQEPDDAPLSLRLFGPFDARVHGEPLRRLRSRKGAWLLALLVLRAGRAVQRSWLAGTLWPESDEGDALYSLRRSLSDLRAAMGVEAGRIQSPTPQTLRLDLTGCWADVALFDAAISASDEAERAAAVELHRGSLLEGCNEEWCLPERASREAALSQALEHLADCARSCGDRTGEIHRLRRLLAIDPYREPAVKALLAAQAAREDYAAAARTFLDFRRLLKRELGTDPSADLQALFDQVQASSKSKPVNKTADTASTKAIPVALTPLLGRESELEAVLQMLDAHRLVTLTGAGGIGKTRLALEAGRRFSGEGRRGLFADLSAVSDGHSVRRELMRAAADWTLTREPQTADLIHALSSSPTLLVVDNCEHVIGILVPLLSEILRSCPDLRVLATSRQALKIAGERLFSVPPLRLEAEDPAQTPAVHMFCLHASFVDPEFRLTAENSGSIATICRGLEGIPLAIELAAARVRLLSPEQIAARLDQRLTLLESGPRDGPDRHRTLRAALAWSYDLLVAEEQRLFRRLSLLIGSWDLNAARALSGTGLETLLEGLIEKSLVISESRGTERRFRILETLREFGLEKLDEVGDTGEVQLALARWAVTLAGRQSGKLRTPQQREALEALDSAYPNLLMALQALTPGSPEALRLAAALWRYWDLRGHWTEGLESLRCVDWTSEVEPAVQAEALLGLGVLLRRSGDLAGAEAALSRSESLWRAQASRYGIAAALHEQGLIALLQGDFQRADECYCRSWELADEQGDTVHLAALANDRGELARSQGHLDEAESLFARCLDLSRRLNDLRGMASALANLGNLAAERGQFEEALHWGSESLEHLTALGDRWGMALVLNNLGFAHVGLGNAADAEPLFREAADLRQSLGDLGGLAHSLAGLSAAASLRGDDRHGALFAGAVDALREGKGVALDPVDCRLWEAHLARSKERIGRDAFRRSWRRGRYSDWRDVWSVPQAEGSATTFPEESPTPRIDAVVSPARGGFR